MNNEIEEYKSFLKRLTEKEDNICGEQFFADDRWNCTRTENERTRIAITSKEGRETASVMEIKDDVIYAMPGSTKERGQMNEFLNYPMAGKTYIIGEDAIIYKTKKVDEKIIVTYVRADYSKMNDLPPRNEPAKHVNKRVVKGREKVVEAGHIVANRFRGPNEAINLIPMSCDINKREWKSLENVIGYLIEESENEVITEMWVTDNQKEIRVTAYLTRKFDNQKGIQVTISQRVFEILHAANHIVDSEN